MRNLALIVLPIVVNFSAAAQNKFEKDILTYETNDKTIPPTGKDLIVFTGSSSIVKWTTLASDFPDKNVINRGFGGSETSDLIEFSDRIITAYHPKQVFIYEGDNDLGSGKTPDQVFNNFKILFTKIKDKNKQIRISFISIKPSPSRKQFIPEIMETNKMIENFLSSQKNADYIDVFNPMYGAKQAFDPELYQADSLHMTPKGYQIWTKEIQPFLVK
jgi:lysophospholipase L1-like esterase